MTSMKRRGFLMIGLAATGMPGSVHAEYRGYETPRWKVLDAEGLFELREYDPYLAAEVTIRAGPDKALRQGFQTLADYIFGGNDGGAKLAMTSPVTREPAKIEMTAPVTREAAGDAWTVRFMMPRKYTADTLPKPDNDAIRIVTVDPGVRAVARFSGLATEARIADAERGLRRWIGARDLRVTGPAEAAWFDDPFTLPWRRRNEVSLPVAMS